MCKSAPVPSTGKRAHRVGRMADTREFGKFRTDANGTDPALMALLRQEAPEKIPIFRNMSLFAISAERRIAPLNIWLEQVEGRAQLSDAIEEYGNDSPACRR